ncbi:YciI family protein [Planktomarina temperata]|nr:YciI family protein [Planktomarina temperata]
MVMLISFGAGRLMEAQGGVMIQYAGLELSFGALQAALLVLEVENMAAAQAWAENDPYNKAGLFESVTLSQWKKVIG